MKTSGTYTISDLAKHFDITPRTIRFYEDQGLLAPQRQGIKRIYKDRDLVRLKLILRGKRIGFSLAEIKRTLELYDTEPNERAQLVFVLHTIESHRQALLQRQQDIASTLEEMKSVVTRVKRKLKTLD